MPTAGAQKLQIAAEIRAWMLGVLEKTGWSPRKWALEAGLAASTVQKAIKPEYPFVTSSRSLAMLAQVANVDPPNAAAHPTAEAVTLPIRYRVQAGAWYEVAATQDFFGSATVAADPGYSQWPQWLEEPLGDSMNREIPEGALVLVVDAIEMGYAPVQDDIVVVERRRAAGQLRERSLKQVHIREDGVVELWPRSYNASWNAPLLLHEGGAGEVRGSGVKPPQGEQVEVEIVGVVISYTKQMRRRR